MIQDGRHFVKELEELQARLLTMGRLAEERVRTSVGALVDRNAEALAQVIAGDAGINGLHIDIDDRCFTLLALHQPVAVDLRTVLSTLKINAGLERVGDLAVNIAEAGQRYLQHAPVKPLIDLPRMAELAMKSLREALDAFVSRDVRPAQAALRQEAWLGALKDQIVRELLTFMLGEPRTIEPSIDLILITRHLERVGDHARNIAEDVVFIVEARDIRHCASRPITITGRTGAGSAASERRKRVVAAPV